MKTTFRTSILFLLILSLLLPLPARAEEVSLDELFQRVVEEPENPDLYMLLSDAFDADPGAFITLLSEKDPALQSTVSQMVSISNGGSVLYVQLVLSQFPEYMNSANAWLLYELGFTVTPKLYAIPEGFTETLLTALHYSDGALSTSCTSLACTLFEKDPKGLIAALALEDAEFQSSLITGMAYSGYSWDGSNLYDTFHLNLNALASDETLTETEKAIVTQLAAKVEELETPAPSTEATAEPTTAPEESLPSEAETTQPTETQTATAPVREGTSVSPILLAAICIAMAAVVVVAVKKKK